MHDFSSRFATAFVLAIWVAGCSSKPIVVLEDAQTADSDRDAPDAAAEEPLRDSQIFEILNLANGGLAKQAALAETKAENTEVREFAAMLSTHHARAQRDARRLAKALGIREEESPASGRLDAAIEAAFAALEETEASEFDNVYVATQVDQHQNLLGFITEKLLGAATHPQLKVELSDLAKLVEHHLVAANELSGS